MKKWKLCFGRAVGQTGHASLKFSRIAVTLKDILWLLGTAAAFCISILSGIRYLCQRFPLLGKLF